MKVKEALAEKAVNPYKIRNKLTPRRKYGVIMYLAGFDTALEISALSVENSVGISKGEMADAIRNIGNEEVEEDETKDI